MTQKMPQTGSITTTSKADSSAPSATTELKEGLVGGARDVSTQAKHVVEDLAGEAKKVADSKLESGRDFAAERLGSVARALRRTSQQLGQEDGGITRYVETAAGSVDKVSKYLQTRTLSQLLGDVQSYARREPAVFLGGAFVAGLLGGRFLKAAPPRPSTMAPTQAMQPAQSRQFTQPTPDSGAMRRGDGNGSSPRLDMNPGASKGAGGG